MLIKCLLLVVAFVFYADNTNACDFSISAGIGHISESCQLLTNQSPNENRMFFLQTLYLSKNKAVSDVAQSLMNIHNLPVNIQQYNGGYRLLVGPIDPNKSSKFSQYLLSLGYKETILKSLNLNAVQIKNDKIKTKVVPVWFKLAKIGELEAVVARDNDGKLLTYDVNGYKNVCRNFFGEKTRLAMYSEYVKLLTSLPTAEKLGLQYRFWLIDGTSITRVADKIVVQSYQNTNEFRPLVCMTPVL